MTVCATVNGTLDPSLKEQLLSGELLEWQCAGCGAQRLNVHPILYHDMNHAFLIYWISEPYAPTLPALAAAVPSEQECQSFRALQPDYRFRVVREFDDLVEKIRIFESELDDRAIEWMKSLYARAGTDLSRDQRMDAVGKPLESVRPRFRRCRETEGKRRLEFSSPALMQIPGLPPAPLTLIGPYELYERALQHLDAHLPWPDSIGADFLIVDENYIEQVWSRLPDIRSRETKRQPEAPEQPQPSPPTNVESTRPWWKFW